MAEEAHDRAKKRVAGGDDIQSRIKASMRSRLPYFKEQADSLTLEGVRRLLEKDMGLETRELDSHKRFIRLSLDECLVGSVDKNDSKGTAVTAKKSAKEEAVESPDGFKGSKDKKEPLSEEKEKMEDSPVMGLLTGNKTENEKRVETEVTGNKEVPNESTIKIAVRERVSYVKANSEKVTMAGFRRLLEEDLKLEKNTLDPYKKLITEQLDEALNSYEDSEPADGLKKKNIKNNSQRKVSKRGRSEESSDSLDSENNEEDEVKPKRKVATKAKTHNSEGAKKRKRPEREVKESGKKRVKSEANSDAEESGASEDSLSQSSAEKPMKKRELTTPAYDKRVENLKSVIKSCGMSIPPAVYKKVKQVPENKREAQLIKELEEILAREGLSSNPSEKEIKEVKKKKDRAKELEGIDMNNIVSSSRRRSTTTFVAPPKPPPVVTDADESEDSDSNDGEDDDDSDDEGNDDEEENGGDDGDDEEVEDGEDDDSD